MQLESNSKPGPQGQGASNSSPKRLIIEIDDNVKAPVPNILVGTGQTGGWTITGNGIDYNTTTATTGPIMRWDLARFKETDTSGTVNVVFYPYASVEYIKVEFTVAPEPKPISVVLEGGGRKPQLTRSKE